MKKTKLYKHTLEHKKEFARKLGYEVRETDNFGVDDDVQFRHPQGYEFSARWDHFRTGASRGDGRERPGRYIPYELVEEMFRENGYELVTTSKEYKGFTKHVDSKSPKRS